VNAEAKKMARPTIASGGALIFTDEEGTAIHFDNTLIDGSKMVVGFCQSYDPSRRPGRYSVALFFNTDMIACDHGATWELAMAYILAVLSAKTAKEAAASYGELHPRFTVAELIRRVRNPNWEAEWESEQAAQAAA
jgi:hypothetical protein